MTQEVKAKLRFLKMGPRKVRLVADLIRGKKISKAVEVLSLLNKKAARPVLKLLLSAVANAKNNFSLEEKTLKLKSITVDEGPTLKRWMPKARGRATPIRERSSHVTIVLTGEKVEPKKSAVKKEENDKKAVKKKETVTANKAVKKDKKVATAKKETVKKDKK